MNLASYRESHLHKGADYHDTFSSLPHRAMMWSLEQRLLVRLMLDLFPGRPPRYLDFACGTGRILQHVSPYCSSSVGVDVSASMLGIARRTLPEIDFIEADITRDDQLGNREFDLITVFRFFANAERELRREAIAVLRRHLSRDGVIIFNNHKNGASLKRRAGRAMRWIRRQPHSVVDRVMSADEVTELVAGAGLRIQRQHHFGVLPSSDGRMLLPPARLHAIEWVLGRVGFVGLLAQNLIYVCRPA